MIVKFPANRSRRIASRRPRRSKNGTREERAAKAAEEQTAQAVPIERIRKQRSSKNGTAEERAAKVGPVAAVIDLMPRRIERLQALARPMTHDEFAEGVASLNRAQAETLRLRVDDALRQTMADHPSSAWARDTTRPISVARAATYAGR